MINRFFSDDMMHILASPERWKIVSSRFSPEALPITDDRHSAWMRNNSEGHSHCEVLFALSGEVNYGFKQDVYPCTPGTIFLFDSAEEHDCGYPPWALSAEHLWIYFLQDKIVMRVLSVKDGTYRPLAGSGAMLSLSALPMRLFGTPQEPMLPAGAVRLRTIGALIGLIMSFIELGYAEECSSSREFRRSVIKVVEQHIQETSGCGISLDSLARLSGYSKYHLERLFKEHTGYSVHKYVDRCRIAKFREMAKSGHSMKEISAALGFTCQSSFSRWHKDIDLR